MQLVPCILYKKDVAEDGKQFNTEADRAAALADGWVETPAALDPNYVPPVPVVIDGIVQAFGSKPYVEFPKALHDKMGNSVQVNSQEEQDTYNSDIWREKPDSFRTSPTAGAASGSLAPASGPAAAPAGASEGAASGEVGAESAGDAPTNLGQKGLSEEEEAARAAAFAEKAAVLHGMTVTQIEERIASQSDLAILAEVQNMEALRGDGPRIGVIKAVRARVKALQADPS